MTIPHPRTLAPAASLLLAASFVLGPGGAASAQESTRIWARVGTEDGDTLEGFLRWDRNEGSWTDVLDGSKPLEWEKSREWVRDPDVELTSGDRVVEYGGYRITWDDSESEFPFTAESGVRFGHVQLLRITGRNDVEVVLRSGASLDIGENPIVVRPSPGVTVIMEGGSTDLGYDMRELLVDVPGGDVVELDWTDLEWVEFGPAPEGVRPRRERLFGTVETSYGPRFTGPISWDNDEAFFADTLDGDDEEGRGREIPFRRIESILPGRNSSEVILTDGERLILSGSDDVDDGNDGVQVSDPGLGRVEVDWDEIQVVRFHPPPPGWEVDGDHGAFDGGHRLRGTVVTVTGEELVGWIRWDADEEYSWEFLDGTDDDGTAFDVEFGKIASIARASDRSATVTLLDGRSFELDGSNDVNDENKGILVRTAELEALEDPEEPKWIRVRWDDFEIVRFQHPETQGGSR